MSLMREGLRTLIRTFAPVVVLGYVAYKFYDKLKDTDIVKQTISTYRILYKKIKGVKKDNNVRCINN